MRRLCLGFAAASILSAFLSKVQFFFLRNKEEPLADSRAPGVRKRLSSPLKRGLHQLNDCHFGGVAAAGPDLYDAGIAAVTGGVLGADLI